MTKQADEPTHVFTTADISRLIYLASLLDPEELSTRHTRQELAIYRSLVYRAKAMVTIRDKNAVKIASWTARS